MILEPLETERLILRELCEADFADVHECGSNIEVVRYMSFGPNTEEDTRNFLQRTFEGRVKEPREAFSLGVVIKTEPKLIGGCGIRFREQGTASIGYSFNRKFWGKGYATEVARRLLEFGFNNLKLHRIFATCDVDNQASANVLTKIGMRREGHFLEDVQIRGQWRNSFLFAILEREWRAG